MAVRQKLKDLRKKQVKSPAESFPLKVAADLNFDAGEQAGLPLSVQAAKFQC